MLVRATTILLLLAALPALAEESDAPLLERVTHGYADSDGVKIHYAELGEGPLLVLVHGFPDFWYSWRFQMSALAEHFHVVAIDQRGYNKSDKPEGQENYDVSILATDVANVIKHHGAEKATVVGHDWGGMVAWFTAMQFPDLLEGIVVLNLPHPKCLLRELSTNSEQQAGTQYVSNFQQPDAHKALSPEILTMIVAGDYPDAIPTYTEAFRNSDIEALLHYYKQNFPRPPYEQADRPMPNIQARVLQFHGLNDTALHADGLNDTWKYIDNTWQAVAVPDASHWVHHDKPELVTRVMLNWLLAD